jgi:hypothetical protein
MTGRWLALTLALVVLALIIGIVIAPGGGGLALASYADQNLSVLVPHGWRTENLAAPYGTALVGWVDAGNLHTTEVVQATLSRSDSTPPQRAQARARELRHSATFLEAYLGPVQFYGGRPAWELEYFLHGYPTAVFEFNSCSSTIAMTVTLSASSVGTLDNEQLTMAEDAEPKCDGPAFTSPDRADLAIPLRLPD